jgi:poly(3-hydroxybutyrate) depolymerase
MKNYLLRFFVISALLASAAVAEDRQAPGSYSAELNIPYCTADGKTETLNAFLPANSGEPTPVMVEIHGGWFEGGSPLTSIESVPASGLFTKNKIAIFSIAYRLGKEGGFPQNIRDCRNAIRFIRKNAKRFNIDPNRIDCMGGSAGGHLSLMVAMVPEDFEDGGPTEGLNGVSARVSGCFSWIPPTDFLRSWNQGPDDVLTGMDGKLSFRPVDGKIPSDTRPHLRMLFHGVTPDTAEHKALYEKM